MELEQIQPIVDGIVKRSSGKAGNDELKRALSFYDKTSPTYNIVQTLAKDLPQYVDYYQTYIERCRMRDRIAVHAENIAHAPAHLFLYRAPRMTDEELVYTINNFKQVTRTVYSDFLSTVARVFNDTSWSITFPEIAAEDFQEYVETGVPIYGSVETFTKSILPHIKLTDANGCLVIRPKEFPVIEDEDGVRLDNTKPFEPMQFYFRSEQLVSFSYGEYYLFESDEKSDVEVGSQTKREGRVFEFYDRNQIVFIRQIGKKTDYNFEYTVKLQHNWNRCPVEFLKGTPQISSDGIMWISPFYSAVDLLDLVILNETNLQASINSCVYPFKIMEGNECDFEDRSGEKVEKCTDGYFGYGEYKRRCPQCGGSGIKSTMGPMGVMLVKRQADYEDKSAPRLRDPIMYVSPDTAPLKFLMEKIAKDELKARRILHLSTSSSDVQPGDQQLATGMVLDLKALYAFLKTIADQIFDLMLFQYEAMAMYLKGAENYKEYVPSIAYPVGYDFKTESDYLREISEAAKAGLPPFVIHTIVFRYVSSLYFNDVRAAKVFQLLVATDRLLTFSQDEIERKQRGGLAQEWEIILHDSGLSLIDQLATENEGFLSNTDFEEMKAALIERAKTLSATIKQEKNDAEATRAQNSTTSILEAIRLKDLEDAA